MSIGFGRTATQDLTHVGIVLAPQRSGGRWLGRAAWLAVALVAGAFAGFSGRGQLPAFRVPAAIAAGPAVTPPEVAGLRAQLEQARLAQRLGDARSLELERQVDALNQRLRETQDELTFFRQARSGKH